MKRSVLFISILIVTFLFTGVLIFSPQHVYAKTKVLRLVVPSPPGDWPLTFLNEELAKNFNKRAKGEYKIEVHAGGALAILPEYFDAVRVGAVEMACAPWGFYSFKEPRLGILETPFLFSTSKGASSACDALLPIYDQILQEKFNAKGLSIFNPGGIHFMSTKPIKTLEDIKSMLTGAISPPTAALVKELGGSPVVIMWTDMYESLQKKVIDAVTNGTHGALVMGMMDVCKHSTIFFGLAGWNGFTINLDVWNEMPKHIQQALQEEATKAGKWMSDVVDNKVGKDDVRIYKEEKGVEVYILPKDERDRWEKKVTPYINKQIAGFGEFGQKIKKIADEANKKYPYAEEDLY